jgi:hypothetical protein
VKTKLHFADSVSNSEDFYLPTAGDGWRKFMPRDNPSAHWFNAGEFDALIHAYSSKNKDYTLRQFVQQFKGLTGSSKAKQVCDELPTVSRLMDLQQQRRLIPPLLHLMQEAASAPKPEVLGLIGEEHFEKRLDEWYGILPGRFWYKPVKGVADGLPFMFEVAVAETHRQGRDVQHALNFSPTFSDPFKDREFTSGKVSGKGIVGYLINAHVLSYSFNSVAAFHLTMPGLQFLDKGKTNIQVSDELANQIEPALWFVSKHLHKEYEALKRDAASAERRRAQEARLNDESLKLNEAVFKVMYDAYMYASSDEQYPVSQRNLYYPVRRMIQEYTTAELKQNYFYRLLTRYQLKRGPLKNLYYDPRGFLYEPHTGRPIPLGTREVEAYTFPSWLYNKILYIEKKGIYPGLEALQLAERYDMAIMAAEGYASEAARVLLDKADKSQNYQLFVLHDADPAGYEIARTLRQETQRMPGYSVEVIDLGLHIEDALARGLQDEEFTRDSKLPKTLELTDEARRRFTGRKVVTKEGEKSKESWIAQRVELNALPPVELAAYIEEKLAEHGAVGKVIPPSTVLTREVERRTAETINATLKAKIFELLDIPSVTDALTRQLLPTTPDQEYMEDCLDEDRSQPWRQVVDEYVQDSIDEKDDALTEALKDALKRLR